MESQIIALSVAGAFILGLTFGAGACNVSCLPYLGPVFFSSGNAGKKPWKVIVPFSLGRLIGYITLASVAAYIGSSMEILFQSRWSGVILGCATFTAGLLLLLRQKKGSSCHKKHETKPKASGSLPIGYFFMGLGMTFTPCLPFGTILFASAAGGSVVTGINLGLFFGLGAVIIPALLFGFAVARLGETTIENIGKYRPHLERFAASTMMLIGAITFSGVTTL